MKSFLKKITPRTIKVKRREYITKYNNHKLKWKVIKYLEKELKNNQSVEKLEIINFLKHNPLSVFPYKYTKEYNPKDIPVYMDSDCNMKYVLQDNKRLYFKRGWDDEQIKKYYNGLLIEQDIDSPHRYEVGDFCVQENDIVVDVGVAEGNFSLSVVEKAKKSYLFEVDEEWIDVLKITFAPWKEKVVIVNKYVSDTNNNNCVKLDNFLKKEKLNFLKADIEGAELQLLKGAKTLLSTQHSIKIAICT
ncbi:hypothetical protein EZS27_023318 [termite gut metagenome]|uniref:Methyltransferase FkbM domain-containing protein n=1 Tax=termite gut metagenome TaxID=433724 RepID=A0A5J4R2A2_9ZZZZ